MASNQQNAAATPAFLSKLKEAQSSDVVSSSFVHDEKNFRIQHHHVVANPNEVSIQTILDHLPADDTWALIDLAPGLYQQQIFIRRNKTIIRGHGKHQTIVRFPILRAHFLKTQSNTEHASDQLPQGAELERDWGAAVINIAATDIVLLDMTVHNSYALENPTDPNRFSHQFALRGFSSATRILTDQVDFASAGADTVSLWNKATGMYFHSNGRFSGRVDLMCPRGTAFIRDSEFVNLQAVATLWHDGELAQEHKLVVVNSDFHGVSGFELARHHYDGQFYLIHNRFSNSLANQTIYHRVYPTEPWRDKPLRFGQRYFFYGNQLAGNASYPWLEDNLTADKAQRINADWTFQGLWQPEQLLAQIREFQASKVSTTTQQMAIQ